LLPDEPPIQCNYQTIASICIWGEHPMPAEVREKLKFVLVETVDDLLAAALEGWPRRSGGHSVKTRGMAAKSRAGAPG